LREEKKERVLEEREEGGKDKVRQVLTLITLGECGKDRERERKKKNTASNRYGTFSFSPRN